MAPSGVTLRGGRQIAEIADILETVSIQYVRLASLC